MRMMSMMFYELQYYRHEVTNRRVKVNCLVLIWYTVYALGNCCILQVLLIDKCIWSAHWTAMALAYTVSLQSCNKFLSLTPLEVWDRYAADHWSRVSIVAAVCPSWLPTAWFFKSFLLQYIALNSGRMQPTWYAVASQAISIASLSAELNLFQCTRHRPL